MNPSTSDHWRSQPAPPSSEGQRPFAGLFGTNGAAQPSHVLPPPPSSYPSHHAQQPPVQHQPPSTGHSLSIADLTQGPPSHSQYNTQPPPAHTQPHQISGLTGTLPHQSPDYLNREREIREIRAREEMRDRERSRDQLLHERDVRDRQLREQQAPHQSHAGSIPIHQPVASKVQGALQGPNGLLGNGGASAAQQAAVTAAASQGGLFGLANDQRSAYALPQSSQTQGQPQSFISGPSPMSGHAQLAHGQQPILNDALSYLDQVKVRFSDQPDVYNRFLDIMKDFKSQAIDTPGVINRVSELFNGHPTLIQGFNTFLPPGYRIECGTDENPDAIRVTTPSGTMTQSLQPRGRNAFEPLPGAQGLPRQENIESARSWGQQVSPTSRAARLPGYDQTLDRFEQDAAMQQDQRNVSQLQSAVSAAANGRPGPTSSPTPAQAGLYPAQGGMFGAAVDLKRGGPVEFNHAISYVNKIKNRFAQQPEIYKQFLEILQTYQRESKPIQDVYSQVTQLFLTAPDLLEDFKQFLPESAAHAKAQATARAQQAEAELSALRGEPTFGGLPQAQTPRPTAKMPPMGQFDPPSTSKENKKRKVPATGMTQTQAHSATDARARTAAEVIPAHANKRQKLENKPKVDVAAAPAVDPTLIPALPEPLPPAPIASATQEELGFFDRAKKQIGNRASYAEFLKLMNLYTQDLIDKYILADRVQAFIGSNPDLMTFFKSFLGIEEHDEVIEARARPDPGRVNLAHCRAFGPSYRHLPKRDQNKTCKGRDGMCYEVLNDVWASHPTWASEDSGFVAHRKNQYEEALHRIEEERHDYDFHIETCQRTIQLMDPLVQQIGVMNNQERQTFRVDRGLGGASEAIPKRIILKVYGREIGNRVLNDMYERPAQVLPIVLQRLKQKLEEWKQVQREWEKVWRDQTQKQFWKSLDHQGINTKNIDKKNFQQKTLTSEIQAKYEEQKRSRDNGLRPRKHQLEYSFKDKDVLAEATELILIGLDNVKSELNSGQQARVRLWLQDFVVKFFGLDKDKFIEQVETALQQFAMPPEEMDDGNESEAQVSGSKKALHKSGDWLRRAALERRNGKEDSAAPTSKESTPAPEAMSETSVEVDAPQTAQEEVEKKWIRLQKKDSPAKEVSMDELYDHTSFNFYANATIYCFFRLFEMLYSRLLAIKHNEGAVEEAVRRWKGEGLGLLRKPALSLNMIDKTPDKCFKEVSGERDFYSQVLEMCAEVIVGRLDLSHLEDTLRRYYNKSGWQLYTVDKLVAAITRFILNILGGDAKDKSLDITNLFFKDREREQTTRKQELQYRKQVEKMSKDGEVFRITWTPGDQLCTIKLFPPDDSTFDSNELTDEARWQYYVASYSMSDPTEGVDHSRVKRTLLQRNIQQQDADVAKAYAATYGNLLQEDEQEAFIDLDTYKMHHKGHLSIERTGVKPRKRYEPGKIEEREPFKEKFVRNVAWMKDQRAEDVEARKTLYDKGVKEGLAGFEDQFGK